MLNTLVEVFAFASCFLITQPVKVVFWRINLEDQVKENHRRIVVLRQLVVVSRRGAMTSMERDLRCKKVSYS